MVRLFGNLARGIRLAWDASRAQFALTVTLTLIASSLPALEVWLGKRLIDLVIAGDRTSVASTAIVLGVVFGAQRMLNDVRHHQSDLYSLRVVAHAMGVFLAKAASVDVGHLDDPAWHDRADRARRDITWLPAQMTMSAAQMLGSTATLASLVGLVAAMHPALAGLLVVAIVPSLIIQRRVLRWFFELRTVDTPAERERMYMADLLGAPTFAKEIRSFGLAGHLLGRFTAIADEQARDSSRLLRRAAAWSTVSATCTAGAVAAAYYFIAARGLAATLTPGDLAAGFGAFTVSAGQANALAFMFGQLERYATFFDDYRAFMAAEPLVPVPAEPVALPSPIAPGLALEGVHFTYPRGTREALAGLDLEVEPGEMIALVGENGAGKTTIVNLLSRFYDPTHGRVCLGGVDLRELDPSALRSRIGVLLQDFAKYQLTVRDNVRLGRIERATSDLELTAALEAARARFLLEPGRGLDARVGRMFEGGHDLSGGEWQRLAVARLMYRGAELWILDEPTSNLDPEAEAAIFSELKQQLEGRMAIVISHRFSTVRVADRIYVIERGRVLESGSHDELIAARGRYAELFEVQAAGYR